MRRIIMVLRRKSEMALNILKALLRLIGRRHNLASVDKVGSKRLDLSYYLLYCFKLLPDQTLNDTYENIRNTYLSNIAIMRGMLG